MYYYNNVLRYRQRLELENQVKDLKRSVKVAQGMVFKSELKARKRILKKLGYCRCANVTKYAVLSPRRRLICFSCNVVAFVTWFRFFCF